MSRAEHSPVAVECADRPAKSFHRGWNPRERVTVSGIEALRRAVDERLGALSPQAAALPQPLGPSIAYSLLAPGKRLRPVMMILTAMQCGADEAVPLDIACAAEMVHVASLIFDDLPCMDDAALRRGKPACHIAFGEDTAILSAVSLLAMAFRTIAEQPSISRAARLALVSAFSEAIGPGGLVAGQISDLRERAPHATLAEIRQVNFRKTAALFCACAEAGVLVAGGGEQDRAHARSFAENVGLAFQIFDDLKDAVLSAPQIGKDVRKDAAKPTMVSALGRGDAAAELRTHAGRARHHALRIGARHDPLLAFLDSCFPEALLLELAAEAA